MDTYFSNSIIASKSLLIILCTFLHIMINSFRYFLNHCPLSELDVSQSFTEASVRKDMYWDLNWGVLFSFFGDEKKNRYHITDAMWVFFHQKNENNIPRFKSVSLLTLADASVKDWDVLSSESEDSEQQCTEHDMPAMVEVCIQAIGVKKQMTLPNTL